MKKHLLFILFFVPLLCFGQTYNTYDEALEGFKTFASNKGFKACEAKYDACKHLKKATMRTLDEQANQLTGRMDIEVIYDYKYVGCYIGWDQYNGSAKIKGYITQTPEGKFKYGERGVEVLHWDIDD